MNRWTCTAVALAAGPIAAGLVAAAPVAVAGVTPAVSGYQVVSQTFTATAHAVSVGKVQCPTGTKVISGGAQVNDNGLGSSLLRSTPFNTRTWYVAVANTTDTSPLFIGYAVCAKAPGYNVVSDSIAVAPNSQAEVSVLCPIGTVPLGGGGGFVDRPVNASLNASIPNDTGWLVRANNNTATFHNAVVYAVCATAPAGYQEVDGAPLSVSPGTQSDQASATCPAGLRVLGGGNDSSRSDSPLVSMNSTAPQSGTTRTWIGYEDNASTDETAVAVNVLCGRAAG